MDSSLGRLNQLSLRLRLLREQAIWQREATNTVTELLAAAADLEHLAAERMRLLASVHAARQPPKRSVPAAVVDALQRANCGDGDCCAVCLGPAAEPIDRDGDDDLGDEPRASEPVALPCECKSTFHRACIGKWLSSHHTCPMCRHELPFEETAAEDEGEFTLWALQVGAAEEFSPQGYLEQVRRRHRANARAAGNAEEMQSRRNQEAEALFHASFHRHYRVDTAPAPADDFGALAAVHAAAREVVDTAALDAASAALLGESDHAAAARRLARRRLAPQGAPQATDAPSTISLDGAPAPFNAAAPSADGADAPPSTASVSLDERRRRRARQSRVDSLPQIRQPASPASPGAGPAPARAAPSPQRLRDAVLQASILPSFRSLTRAAPTTPRAAPRADAPSPTTVIATLDSPPRSGPSVDSPASSFSASPASSFSQRSALARQRATATVARSTHAANAPSLDRPPTTPDAARQLARQPSNRSRGAQTLQRSPSGSGLSAARLMSRFADS
ncbi:hypothetical protein M885DRAFT_584642 [Pelagophyceae sp. CCMP2097]|nr:hypothetical protein M885DRAFT_584642 [Pelagophyceae sp. CCMP2097]